MKIRRESQAAETDDHFYEMVVHEASRDSVLTEAVTQQLDGSRTDGQDEWVEAYIHDEGYVSDLGARYGLFPDFCVAAYRECIQRVRKERSEQA